jgi:hypothetical protein
MTPMTLPSGSLRSPGHDLLGTRMRGSEKRIGLTGGLVPNRPPVRRTVSRPADPAERRPAQLLRVGELPDLGGRRRLVLTGAWLRWVAPRRGWPAVVRAVVLDRRPYRLQGAAAGRDVLVVDMRGRGRIIRTDGARRPSVRATLLGVNGGVGAASRVFAFARGPANWLPRAGATRRLADTQERESPELIQPFGDRALTVAFHERPAFPTTAAAPTRLPRAHR